MMVLEVCALDAVVDDTVDVDEEDEELLVLDEVVGVGEEAEETARVVVTGAAEVAATVAGSAFLKSSCVYVQIPQG
jgi:hypothetical protein